MNKLLGIPALFFLCSCASLHTPSPHFVPSITAKDQFEGGVSVGFSSASVNFAYSPLNHLTIMGNVQGLPVNLNSQSYQRNCEMAVGTYGSRQRIIYGLNGGYGMGDYNWDYIQFNDTSNYSIHTQGNFQKVMLQTFFAFTDNTDTPGWAAGLSLKGNFYWDQYVSVNYAAQQNRDFSGLQKNTSFEPCLFTKHFFARRFYLGTQAGMNISYDHSMFWPMQYVFVRIGLGIKL